MNIDTNKTRVPVYSVALLSATALSYEVLLVRLFSIIQWHHFAYMIISLALLGYGASGSFLMLAQRRLLRNFNAAFVANLVLFGVSSLACYLFAQAISFNPEELVFDNAQWLNLARIYLLLAVPFFFAANAIGLALTRYKHELARVYAFDLVGAGLGSLSIVVLLFLVHPMTALWMLSTLGVLSGLLAAWELGLRARRTIMLLLSLAALTALVPGSWVQPRFSPYKDLSQTLRISGSRVILQQSSPLGLINIVENDLIPLRHAPGLSLNARMEPPQQLGLFVDGNGPFPITGVPRDPGRLDYLDQLTSALPFHLKTIDRTLVLGAGGGTGVLQALRLGDGQVDAVELNPQVVALVRDTYGEFTGRLYRDERVRVITGEVRGFLATTAQSYDLIQLPNPGSFGASSSGLYALSEDYLNTVQAFESYLQHLSAGGFLAVNRWVKLPPRDTLKAVATVIHVLRDLGLEHIGQRLLLIRGWQTSTLLVKNGIFSRRELELVRSFCEQRSFDLAYLPGMQEQEANQFNQIGSPYFYRGTKQLLGNQAADYLSSYKFNLHPATDDRPYFFHFFRWSTLPEIFSLIGQGGVPLMDMGYLVLVATLLQAVAASVLLILLPLLLYLSQHAGAASAPGRYRVLAYFFMLGLAFLFIEIVFMQKLILFLHHPLYAIAVTLTAFLIFAGLGSAYSQRMVSAANDDRHAPGIARPVAVILLLCLLYLATLDGLFNQLLQLPVAARIGVAVAVIAPLAFCMGMPFPLGFAELGRHSEELLPWAWGINGCASVISSVLATLLAMHFGFNFVIGVAALLYVAAAFSFPSASSMHLESDNG